MMAAMAWFPITIVMLLVVLAAFAGLAVLIFRVVRQDARTGDVATCGQCGYGVRGIESWECPECGADLREVGIERPTARRMPGPVTFLVLWTLLLPVPAIVTSAIVVALGPQVRSGRISQGWRPDSKAYDLDLTIYWQTTGRSYAGGGGSSTMSSSGSASSRGPSTMTESYGFPAGSPPDRIKLTIMPTAGGGSASLVWENGRFDGAAGAVTGSGSPSKADIEKFFQAAGIPTHTPEVALEMASVADAVDDLAAGQNQLIVQGFFTRGTASTSRSGPPTWLLIALVVFWLVVYGGGIAGYFRIRQRRLAEAVKG